MFSSRPALRRRRRHRGILAALRALDDDPVLFCDCATGGECGGEHAADHAEASVS